MITYDNMRGLRVPTLDDMFKSETPDEVDCGETLSCRVVAVRSKQIVQLRSLQTGSVITQFVPGTGDPLPPRLRDACVQALRLKDHSDGTVTE